MVVVIFEPGSEPAAATLETLSDTVRPGDHPQLSSDTIQDITDHSSP